MDRPAYRFAGGRGDDHLCRHGRAADDVGPTRGQNNRRPLHEPSGRAGARRGHVDAAGSVDVGAGPSNAAATSFGSMTPRTRNCMSRPQTAEVSVLTTRRSRALAWVGTIPHWLYFAPLRLNGPLWTRIVVWTSALGCVLALIGLDSRRDPVQAVHDRSACPRPFRIPAGCGGTTSPASSSACSR